ncbi:MULTISPECIES: hypothetical protein [unclassified Streptomyces]|uniref:hypothetical protein n=1 Tax=unclassified Streptomyces TaxID=2593676 RepID=UPI00340D8BF9
MHRGLVHTIAWSLATGAAVTLSWWGVHTVMAGTAYDPPRALPLTADDGGPDRAEPLASSTHRTPSSPSDKPSKSAEPPKSSTSSKSTESNDSTGTGHSKKSSPPPPTRAGTGTVKSYNTTGGRVVLDLGKDSATLVSATPAAGWSVQTWKQDKWIRVDFTGGAAQVSVFCTWHDTEPRVEIEKS